MKRIIDVRQLLVTITELFRPFKVHFRGKHTKKPTFGESTSCFDRNGDLLFECDDMFKRFMQKRLMNL